MSTRERFDAVGFLARLFEPAGESGHTGSVEAHGPSERISSPEDLPAEWREHYEERAAIREYEGGQTREHAEAEALTATLGAMRAAERPNQA